MTGLGLYYAVGCFAFLIVLGKLNEERQRDREYWAYFKATGEKPQWSHKYKKWNTWLGNEGKRARKARERSHQVLVRRADEILKPGIVKYAADTIKPKPQSVVVRKFEFEMKYLIIVRVHARCYEEWITFEDIEHNSYEPHLPFITALDRIAAKVKLEHPQNSSAEAPFTQVDISSLKNSFKDNATSSRHDDRGDSTPYWTST